MAIKMSLMANKQKPFHTKIISQSGYSVIWSIESTIHAPVLLNLSNLAGSSLFVKVSVIHKGDSSKFPKS